MLDRNQLTSDLLSDYALGFLGEGEVAEVEAALERFPDARQELNAYLSGLSDLAMDLGPAEVPQGAEDRLLARLNAEIVQATPAASSIPSEPVSEVRQVPPLPQKNWLPGNWLLAALVLAAAVAIGFVALPSLNRSELARYQAQPGAVTSALNDKAGEKVADVVRLPDGRIYVQAQAEIPVGRTYQAWKIEGGKPVSLGLFSGKGFVASVPAGTVFAISVEPEGGSTQPTTTPVFAGAI